ncbi:3-deoxy-D-manno-octulosonic acid kinase [Pseudoalteromonas sp. SSDWG2]|uniref:3-deoxy-D-manno-octulosonic acid kinase n=1 Tax=Pseudoalteromonas sp. SSDWG2 TaxID=3139391 RepID=UPI003BACDE74
MQLTPLSSTQTLFTRDGNPLAVDANWFNPEFWLDQNKVFAQKTGRATAYFFAHKELKAVLRHYWRGGLVGKVLRDEYLYTSMRNTRVYQEFSLMCTLYQQGLPVVEPIAAMVQKSGLIYRGDIITRALEGAVSLCERLVAEQLDETTITEIGVTIAQFHKSGVYHADLNINNILFDKQNKVHVIDFDRGEIRPANTQWQQQNMARLQRSFVKEATRQPHFHWSTQDWQTLEKAYQRAMAD